MVNRSFSRDYLASAMLGLYGGGFMELLHSRSPVTHYDEGYRERRRYCAILQWEAPDHGRRNWNSASVAIRPIHFPRANRNLFR